MYLKCLARLLAAIACAGGVAVSSLASAQTIPGSSAKERITQPVDESRLVALSGNTHPLAQPRFDRGPASESLATGNLILVLRRSAAQDEALRDYLASLQDRSSKNYHRWLTPAQYGAAFGVADSDLQAVELWLQGHGLKIEKAPQARNVIEFSGTIGEVESAFHTAIHSFEVNGERHSANVSDPQIPAALAPVVQGVAQLNDFHPRPQSVLSATGTYDASTKTIKPTFTLFSGSTPLLFTDPADAATIYDTPNAALNPNYTGTTYDGTGVNIGIAGDSNISLPDITNYRLGFLGETAANANVPTVVIDGNDPGLNGDEPEGLLDNEIAGGLAPKAKIYFYISSNTDLQAGLFDAVFRAIDDNLVSILNISFSECEANAGSAGNAVILEANEQAAAQGISVVVSSGDSGSAGCDSSGSAAAQNGLAVNALASTPYTIAVGGTDFDGLPASFATYVDDQTSGTPPYYRTAIQYIPENPWNDSTTVNTSIADNSALLLGGSTNVIAAGGGASAVYSKPSFQTALTPNDSARDLPDVALLAANGLYAATWVVCADSGFYGPDCVTSGGQFVDGAHFSGYGGTSASTPAFAGILALVEQATGSRLGQADYVLYQLASSKYATVFHDVTVGDNSVYCVGGSAGCNGSNFMTGFNAETGYDQASGLGSVDTANLVADWPSVALTTTATSFSINGSKAPLNVTHGTSLAFQVGVTPTAATGVAGIVDTANEVAGGVQNDGQIPIALTGGTGSVTYNGLPGGTYTVYARYGGDATHAVSKSTPAIDVTVAAEASSTALTVSAYDPLTGNPIPGGLSALPYGSEVLFDAQVYGTAEGVSSTQGIATGNVVFTDGGTTVGQAPVSASNTASYPPLDSGSFPAYSVGSHSVTAKYAGDASYNANTSATVAFTVVKAGTSTTGSASATSIPSVASTTVTVTISAASLGIAPTGTVTLKANGSTLGSYTQLIPVGGIPAASQVRVTLQGTQLAAGSNTISLDYSGDGNYTASTGSVVISVTPSKFTLANSGPLSFVAGADTANTATITAAPTNNFVGTINLSCAVTTMPTGATSPATCTVPSSVDITGSASVSGTLVVTTTASTTPGVYAVTVTGTDAATGKVTASTVVNVTITAPPNPAFALSNSGNLTISPGATSGNSATVTVTPSGGFAAAVSLSCAVTTSIASPNDLPTCNIPSSVSITGAAAATATLTVTTTAATSAALRQSTGGLLASGGGAFLAIALFFGIPARRRRWGHLAGLLAVVGLASILGCGGGSGNSNPGHGGTTAGAYLVTVTGTSAGIATQTTTVTVTVN